MKRSSLALAFALAAISGVRADRSRPPIRMPATRWRQQQAGRRAGRRRPRNPNLPPPRQPRRPAARAALKSSPRHGEWVDIKGSNGTPIKIVRRLPGAQDKAPVVIVIHEIFGLSDWIRGVGRSAREGRLHRHRARLPVGDGTEQGRQRRSSARRDRRRRSARVTPDDAVRILNDVRTYAQALPAVERQARRRRLLLGRRHRLHLRARRSRRSTPRCRTTDPMPADAGRVRRTPRRRCSASTAATTTASTRTSSREGGDGQGRRRTYEPHIFEGAGHGFLRQQAGNANAPGNMKATEQAWPLTIAVPEEAHEVRRTGRRPRLTRSAAPRDYLIAIPPLRTSSVVRGWATSRRLRGQLLDRVPAEVDRERDVLVDEPARAAAVVERLARRHVGRGLVGAIQVELRPAEHAAADVAPAVAVAEVQRDLRREGREVPSHGRALRRRAAGRRSTSRARVLPRAKTTLPPKPSVILASAQRIDVHAADEAEASRRQVAGVDAEIGRRRSAPPCAARRSPRTSAAKRPIGSFCCAAAGAAKARAANAQQARSTTHRRLV